MQLFRAPGALLAVVGSAFLLALAVSSRPVFLASVGSASVASDIRDGCRYDVGLRVIAGRERGYVLEANSANLAAAPRRRALLDRIRRAGPGLGPTLVTVLASGAVSSPKQPRPAAVRVLARTGALGHIGRGVGPGGEGIWLPDTEAAALGTRPGDQVALQLGAHSFPIRVAGLFPNLTYADRAPYWCALERQFIALGNSTPLPVVLMSEPRLLELLGAAGPAPAQMWWEIPPSDGLSLPAARRAAQRLEVVIRALQSHGWIAPRPTSLGREFGLDDGVTARLGLSNSVSNAERISRSVRDTADTVGTASTLIALLAVAVAGFFWVDRRRSEVTLLLSKGVAPAALGLKAAIEAAIPATGATVVGIAAAVLFVRTFAPSPVFDPAATAHAAMLAFAALSAGLALTALVAGVRVARMERSMRAKDRRRALSASLGIGALACLGGAAILEHGVGSTRLGSPAPAGSLGMIVVVFPLLVLAGTAGLLAALAAPALPRVGRWGHRWPVAPFLAIRRLAEAGSLALLLAAGSAVSAGILLYSSVIVDSARATLAAKTTTSSGADTIVYLETVRTPRLPPAVASRSTAVRRTSGTIDRSGPRVDLLGVDRSTFERAAFFDRTFADRSLKDLLRELRPSDRSLPVIVAGGRDVPDSFSMHVGTPGSESTAPVRVVARVRAFPGLSAERPLVVGDVAALSHAGIDGALQLWVRGRADTALAELARADISVATSVTAAEYRNFYTLLPLVTSLGYFRAMGLLGGAVTLCGAALYLAARQRARRLAALLARSMGLTRTSARSALVLEIGPLMFVGLLIGSAVAASTASVTFPHLDPSPGTPPALIFRWHLSVLWWSACAVAVTAASMALLAERSAERASASEVIRVDA